MGKTLIPKPIQAIDLARSFAILSVMAYHLKPTLPLPPPALRWAWDHFQRNGPYGVCVFFVISGFLITRIIDRGNRGLRNVDWKWFYARRVGRIVPPFLFSVLLGLAMVWIFQDGSKKFNYCFKLPVNPFDLSFWIPLLTFSFNWASGNWGGLGIHWILFWSLAVEEQFYIFYPFVLKKIVGPEKLAWFLILIVLAGLAWRETLYVIGEDNLGFSMRTSLGAFDQIAMGCLLYLTHKNFGSLFSKDTKLCWLTLAGGGSILVWTYLATFPIGDRADRVFGPTLIAIGIFLSLLGALHLPLFEAKWLKLFSLPGKYSYGNYLFHVTVLFSIHSFLWPLDIAVAFTLFVGASTAFAAASYHLFELPANRFLRKSLGS